MQLGYKENVFRELRLFITDGERNAMTNESLAAAVTLNDNLSSLGFVMKPEDVIEMARYSTSDMQRFFNEMKDYAGEVKAAPMYPGFPEEVLDMDEAQFRMHQLCHYFSTYGIESLFGVSVSRGWLPHDADEKELPERDGSVGFKADLKQIGLLREADAYSVPASIILSRTSRMTENERGLVAEALKHVDDEEIASFAIPFKENMVIAFSIFIDSGSMSSARAICKHPGDVFKCLQDYLHEHKYRLTTHQKRFIVRLLESYDIASFEENLMQSNGKREQVLNMLRFVSYRKFSRSNVHLDAVNALRNGELSSWMSKAEELIEKDKANNAMGLYSEAVPFIAKRPGMMLRMLRRLLKLGYMPELLAAALEAYANELSTKTLVDVLEKTEMTDLLKCVLAEKLKSIRTPLQGKKVFIDEGEYDIAHSAISKSEEGGYIRSGLAFRIPDDLKRLRFFVYWNDRRRVDIDLHSYAFFDEYYEHVGWNGGYNEAGMVTSGDITHSNAAEYIDIDLDQAREAGVHSIATDIHIFSGKPSFRDIDEVLVGMMGVNKLGKKVRLYSPDACFFSHKLVSSCSRMLYGRISIDDGYIRYVGENVPADDKEGINVRFSLKDYIDMLCTAQDAEVVDSREDADIVVSIGKGGDISLIDENFFMDAK